MKKWMLLVLFVLCSAMPVVAQTTVPNDVEAIRRLRNHVEPNTVKEIVERYSESTFAYVIIRPTNSEEYIFRAVSGPFASMVDLMLPLGTPTGGQKFFEGKVPGDGVFILTSVKEKVREFRALAADVACAEPTPTQQ